MLIVLHIYCCIKNDFKSQQFKVTRIIYLAPESARWEGRSRKGCLCTTQWQLGSLLKLGDPTPTQLIHMAEGDASSNLASVLSM